jgi:cell division protein ZapD
MLPIRDGIAIVLRLLRTSGRPEPQVAAKGAYQLMLAGRTAQLVRLRMKRGDAVIPEISANKYALNIRFTMPDTDLRPKQSEADILFELTFCNL